MVQWAGIDPSHLVRLQVLPLVAQDDHRAEHTQSEHYDDECDSDEGMVDAPPAVQWTSASAQRA